MWVSFIYLGNMREAVRDIRLAAKQKKNIYLIMVNADCVTWEYMTMLRKQTRGKESFHQTHSLAVGFIQRTLLFDLGQLHVNLLANHGHGISSWTGKRVWIKTHTADDGAEWTWTITPSTGVIRNEINVGPFRLSFHPTDALTQCCVQV